MYNEVEVKAILIAVHNIENVGLNSKKVLLNSIEWLRCQYEITQDESFLIKLFGISSLFGIGISIHKR